jgi:hypothetical protein
LDQSIEPSSVAVSLSARRKGNEELNTGGNYKVSHCFSRFTVLQNARNRQNIFALK